MNGGSETADDSAEVEQLLRRAGAGDERALVGLFARFRPQLEQFVNLRLDRRLFARVDASDVLQETEMEVCRRLNDFLRRRPMPLHVWLHKTTYEQLIMLQRRHLKAEKRSAEREVPLPERSSMMLARRLMAETPSEQLNRRELLQRVRESIDRLDETDREILLMRNVDGLPYDEAAAIIGISSEAARKRHGRALLRLHEVLKESGLTESQL